MPGATATKGQAALETLPYLPAYLGYAVLKRVVALPRLARWAWRSSEGPAPARTARAIRSVARLSRHLARRDRDCLERSLVLYRELSRTGAGPLLMLGFRQEGDRLVGHAWVEVATARGRSVLPEDVKDYRVAMWFGDGGRMTKTEDAAQR